MTEETYKKLQSFPKDKSYLSHLQLQDLLDPNGVDYNTLIAKCEPLHEAGYVEGKIPRPGLRITDKGLKAIEAYKRKKYSKQSKISKVDMSNIIAVFAIIVAIAIAIAQC